MARVKRRGTWFFALPWLGGLIVVLISLGAFLFLYVSHSDWTPRIDAMIGVTEGTPHWRAFQNRLLAPYAILGLTAFSISYETAYFVFLGGMLVLHGLVFYWLLIRQTHSAKTTVFAYAVWTGMFMLLQDYWLYAWDIPDLIFFTIAAYILVFNASRWILLALLPLAFLNRESAFLLCLIFLLDGLWPRQNDADESEAATIIGSRVISVILGGVLIVLGILYTQHIRNALFVESAFGGDDAAHAMLGNHFNLIGNVVDFVSQRALDIEAALNLLLIALVVYLATLFFRTRDVHMKKSLVFFACMLANLFIFGVISETRIYFPLLSLVIFIVIARSKEITQERTQSGLA